MQKLFELLRKRDLYGEYIRIIHIYREETAYMRKSKQVEQVHKSRMKHNDDFLVELFNIHREKILSAAII